MDIDMHPKCLLFELMIYLDLSDYRLLKCKTRGEFIRTLKTHVTCPRKYRTPIWRKGGLYDPDLMDIDSE